MHWSVWVIMPIVLLMGTVFGAVQGALIHFFRLQAFIVTLAGMFFARGLCFLITTQSITITDPTFQKISAFRLNIGVGSVTANVLIAHRDAGRPRSTSRISRALAATCMRSAAIRARRC